MPLMGGTDIIEFPRLPGPEPLGPTALGLHEIRSVLAKFMRMMFPMDFRLDALEGRGPVPAFRYPLLGGEVLYLPERADGLGSRGGAFVYYKVIAAHLAARHDYGTFDFALAQLPEFQGRGERGVEALDAYVGTFPDPKLAGAMLRLCEGVRIDAALSREFRGLAPEIVQINQHLARQMVSGSVSAMLFKAAAGLAPEINGVEELVVGQAARLLAELRQPGADVLASVRQCAALYRWFTQLIERARRGPREDLDQRLELDELGRSLEGRVDDAFEEFMGGEEGPDDGRAGQGQRLRMKVGGRRPQRSNRTLSAEEIRKLLEEGAELTPSEDSEGAGEGSAQPYLSELQDKELLQQLKDQLAEAGALSSHGRLMIGRGGSEVPYYIYDEWDTSVGDYRRNWCHLREIALKGDDGEFYARTLRRYADLLPQVRRHFQRIRPASYRMVRGLEDGDDFDLDRVIEYRVDHLMGNSPDPRVYKARKREARDVATLFLLDMSASTDEGIAPDGGNAMFTRDNYRDSFYARANNGRPRRIIDINKEALVIMAQALEELGDTYAIMGFSGHGHDNVEVYLIKEFNSELNAEVKARIGAVEPKRATRMGAALRHAAEKFKNVACRSRHVIMLSDGFPQDFDYGQDPRSNSYGIQDTMVALKELEAGGILPFCITVDRTGHDYLRDMCPAARYMVIEDIAALPTQLPKIYEQIVRS